MDRRQRVELLDEVDDVHQENPVIRQPGANELEEFPRDQMLRYGDVAKGIADDNVVAAGRRGKQRPPGILVQDFDTIGIKPELLACDAGNSRIDLGHGDRPGIAVGPGPWHGIGSATDEECRKTSLAHPAAGDLVQHCAEFREHAAGQVPGAGAMGQMIQHHEPYGLLGVL